MKLKTSFYVSLIFYFLLVSYSYFQFAYKKDISQIEIQKGASGNISFTFANRNTGANLEPKPEKISTTEGSIAKEIQKIQNKISYPAQALEDGIESECEWSLVINENGKASNINIIRPCRYKIFEDEFYRVIRAWDFDLPKNTVLQIPVRFKIQ